MLLQIVQTWKTSIIDKQLYTLFCDYEMKFLLSDYRWRLSNDSYTYNVWIDILPPDFILTLHDFKFPENFI